MDATVYWPTCCILWACNNIYIYGCVRSSASASPYVRIWARCTEVVAIDSIYSLYMPPLIVFRLVAVFRFQSHSLSLCIVCMFPVSRFAIRLISIVSFIRYIYPYMYIDGFCCCCFFFCSMLIARPLFSRELFFALLSFPNDMQIRIKCFAVLVLMCDKFMTITL